ncbi:TIGR03960 family B12-binding radical SAM protein [Desulfopila inferna]|uniref:TIGR03960 family B12-binding radical SAM protein n=1 Tax=Desulfopila inferna TaxID=468528 RepID=UPI001964146E|nr:TIGR03960 family B12-binding radical SAM protein [Desulfopila inferna]MBM9604319.1 TIGR03960 family B12-binding radical SAM protein [Desulfopila inferna]
MSQSILPYVSKPGRYLGEEFNSIKKQWRQADVHFALIFPDLYEIGMSHFGLQILYHLLNREEKVVAERCFCPDLDAEKVMEEKGLSLLSLESATPLSSFDVLGITLPYELCYTNILTILKLSAIPFYSRDRDESHPLILGGGSCSMNPEPVADFFDAILLGDGEEAIIEIAGVIRDGKKTNIKRSALLGKLAEIKGVYIPAHFQPEYDKDHLITKIGEAAAHAGSVERRIVADLDDVSHLCNPLVPNAKIVHDRLGVEIARGCTRGCRFCQAGMIYRPVRERTVEQIMKLAEKGIERSGFEELALLSLSTGDYSCIDDLLPELMDKFAERYVSVSMPSMRVGTLSQPVMDQIKRVRKTGFTVAPEAGSERLRQVINKGITEDDLLKTCKDACSMGWKGIKLYFMIGLPTETLEDVEAIAALARKTKEATSSAGNRRMQVTTSVGTFVPKPHTPFQWERQLSLEESRERIYHLKRIMPSKGSKLKWHNPEMSFLEGVFSRGDRRLAQLIETAWSKGARLDGWTEHFDLVIWQQAAQGCDIDLTGYLRARNHDEILPWHHLSSGIDPQFLKDELEKAHSGDYTPDCRYHGCRNCGLCDFDEIKPIVHKRRQQPEKPSRQPEKVQIPQEADAHFKYMVSYSRRGNISYLGHLEILQLLFRTLRRARIRTNFSKGFNPSPKISFGGALPVGMQSEAEFFIMDLPKPLKNTADTAAQLNSCLPEGLQVHDIRLHSGKIPQSVVTSYTVTLPRELTHDEIMAKDTFLDSEHFLIKRKRKGLEKEIDIRPLVEDIATVNEKTLRFRIKSTAGTPGIKVQEALAHILSWRQEELIEIRIVKASWSDLNE